MPWYRIPLNMDERTRRMAFDENYFGRRLTEKDRALIEIWRGREQDSSYAGLLTGGVVHLNFGREGNRKAPAPCCVCGWISERECDWIIDPAPNGDPHSPATCDRPLCEHCTNEPASGKDLCPQHVQLYKGWLAARTNSTDGET